MRKSLVVLAMLGLVCRAASAAAELSFVGSWTMGEHLIPEAAAAFTAETGIRFGAVRGEGGVRGLELLRRGEASLAGIARALSPLDRRHGFYYRIIGYDTVVVVVHPDNPVTTLTLHQLKGLYTGRLTNWKAVGGRDAGIVVITEVWGTGHAPMVWFQGQVMNGAPFRPDRSELTGPRARLAALRDNPRAVTAVSLTFAASGARPIAIDGYPPEPQHARSGAYILSRPLLLVAPPRPGAEVKRFIDFMMSPAGQRIVARRFVPIR
jgi:phosphate transport system substrate-binding protein